MLSTACRLTCAMMSQHSQLQDGNFEIVHRSQIPSGAKVFPAVWQMRRKRDIATQQIKKWKARLNFDGSSMKKGVHYEHSYAPVASWGSIWLALAIAIAHNWVSTQVDYVLAFPQAPVERPVYTDIPRGFEMIDGLSTKDYALLLHGNVYGQKQAAHVWNKYLTKCLVTKAGFIQSRVDECVFYKGNVIYVLYTDDSILFAPTQKEVDNCIADIKAAGLNITVEGDVKDFLGVNIERHPDGTVKFSQPHLINKILKALRIDTNTTPKDTPAASSRVLSRGTNSAPFDQSFHYCSVIGMLNYLDAGSRSDIAYATHQCARFAAHPKKEHGKAVQWIGRYLNGTKEQGMIFTPDSSLGLEVYVDADFAGNWNRDEAPHDRDTARSCHGYIIKYMGCPIVWKSQLQTEIALSSTESEYTGLSYALRETIPMMELLKEMKSIGLPVTPANTDVLFKDNSGAIEMAQVHKYRP